MHTPLSRYRIPFAAFLSAFALLAYSPSAQALHMDLGSDGSDGALNVTTNTVVALPADGVLNYTSINIAAGATLSFSYVGSLHPGVVLLSTGTVVIDGTIDISGQDGVVGAGGAAGPGGSPGGRPYISVRNGGSVSADPAIRAGYVNGLRNYGGAGGWGSYSNSVGCTVAGSGGGGGGGALLILANDVIRGTGTIDAAPGAASLALPSGGSCGFRSQATHGVAGTVRVIAPTAELASLSIIADKFRVDSIDQVGLPTLPDTYHCAVVTTCVPTAASFTAGEHLDAWPSTLPTATIMSAAGVSVPAGGILTVPAGTPGTFTVMVQANGCSRSEMTVGVIVGQEEIGGLYETTYTSVVTAPTGSDTVAVDVTPTLTARDPTRHMDAFVHCGPF
ncbi:MAG: hypothetical protein GXP55_16740 [Deltaproteobacteria bacterium]|nr:hypothetical protein [Deltaproteobacteria bacterium]